MIRRHFLIIFALLICSRPIITVSGSQTIIDTQVTLDRGYDLKSFSFLVNFPQIAEVSISFTSAGGTITLFLMSDANYNAYINRGTVNGWSIFQKSSGSMVQEISSGKWHIILRNFDLVNSKTVTVTASLEITGDISIVIFGFFLFLVAIVGIVGFYFIKRKNKGGFFPSPGTRDVSVRDKFCITCGQPFTINQQFCDYCGTSIPKRTLKWE